MGIASLIAVGLAVVAGGAGVGWVIARRQGEALVAGARRVVEAVGAAARAERDEILKEAEIAEREEALSREAAFEARRQAREAELRGVVERVGRREGELSAQEERLQETTSGLAQARGQVVEREAEIARLREELSAHVRASRAALERVAGQTAESIRASLVDGEIEEAGIAASQRTRAAESIALDEADRRARRLMGIATGRFSGHYLTERSSSTVPIPPGAPADALAGPEEANLRAIAAVAGVTLALTEGRDAIRLEGLDGVGREVARRSLARLLRQPHLAATPELVTRATREVAVALGRELDELGRRAFQTLEIPLAHAEIVTLVGRLNYRTSFTQNQWKHAVEAAFLCGMMAEEMGLDRKLARRAALMHDIGKALTHELDGSHAVIGADYARRLGEPEVVANAIGAHHTDEPFSSPYAYLVAAADAMSGARPGARRQTDDNYLSRIDDLERITRSFRGVGEAFAVQGGREVRVYVQESEVDDLGAVDLSTAIARRISQEMRFPGQIRVTVIRELKAVEVAG